jgi:hypothetical protein
LLLPALAPTVTGCFGARFPSFRLLETGPATTRFAAIPLLMFAAPFIIMRNSVRGGRIERRQAQMVMVATVIAGLWSRENPLKLLGYLRPCRVYVALADDGRLKAPQRFAIVCRLEQMPIAIKCHSDS